MQFLQYVLNKLPADFLIKLQDSVLTTTDAGLKVKGGHNCILWYIYLLFFNILKLLI